MQNEYFYYSTRSLLTPRSSFSLADHRRAYLLLVTGADPKLSLPDLEQLFHPNGERAYWATQAAGDTVAALKLAAFAVPAAASVRIFRMSINV